MVYEKSALTVLKGSMLWQVTQCGLTPDVKQKLSTCMKKSH